MDGSIKPAPLKVTIARKSEPNYAKGRRAFFKYRDLGVQEATGGKVRAQVMEAITGMTEPTGWHQHHCEAQFVYVLKGWVDLEFEDGTRTRCTVGDAILIPGGMKHNEFGTSDDVEILELSVPGPMTTTPCDVPAGMS
jgi:quercetin dioxygenase-like cupin family protein